MSENFLGKVERGGETVQWGKLFQVMLELGLNVTIEVPEPYSDDIRKLLAETVNKKLQREIIYGSPDIVIELSKEGLGEQIEGLDQMGVVAECRR